MSEQEMSIGLNACCMYATEEGVWFVQGMMPILYFYSYKDNQVTVARTIGIGESYGTAYFSSIYISENELYLIPNNYNAIVIYDLEKDSFLYYGVNGDGTNSYRENYEKDGFLYCVPYKSKDMLIIDLKSKDFEYIPLETKCVNSTCRYGDIIYCVEWETNQIVLFDMKSREKHIKTIEGEYKFCSIVIGEKYVYLYDTKTKCLYSFDHSLEEKHISVSVGFEYAILILDKMQNIIIDSTCSDKQVSLIDGELKEIKIEKSSKLLDNTPWKMCCWSKNDRLICITPYGQLIFWDDEICVRDLSINREWYEKLNQLLIKESDNEIIQERELFSLKDFIGVLI